MNKQIRQNIITGLLLLVLQILVFKQVDLSFGDFYFSQILIYPLIFFLLPIEWPRSINIIIAFVVGISVDMFYDSPGVHASAAVFVSFIRRYVLKLLEPFGGYSTNEIIGIRSLGLAWYLSYCSILLVAFLLFYFSMEAFSYIFFTDIVMRSIFSFVPSIIIMVIFSLLINIRK